LTQSSRYFYKFDFLLHSIVTVVSIGTKVIRIATALQVPAPFLGMLLAQFILIIIDRALYLRKQVLGKFIFQILLVFLVHAWMFFGLPAITQR